MVESDRVEHKDQSDKPRQKWRKPEDQRNKPGQSENAVRIHYKD